MAKRYGNNKVCKEMMKISVIVPVYNVENYLSRCVESIIKQTCTNLEIILVDDGSTDASGKMCDEYAQRDNRITVIHKKNGGLSDARNAGLDIATGEYIGFVDSDDFIALNFYEILYNTLVENDSDLVYCKYQKFENEANIKETENYKVFQYDNIEFLNNFYDDTTYKIVVWNKLYKRNIWENLRFPFGKIHEDVFVVHEVFYIANKISFVTSPSYYYFQREDSIMGSQDENMIWRRIINKLEAFDERINFSKTKQLESLYKKTIDARNAWLLNFMFEQRDNQSITEKISNEIGCSCHTFSTKHKIRFLVTKYLPAIYSLYRKYKEGNSE
jgi:glycosyltransferase involved in cell wall biosynthesis